MGTPETTWNGRQLDLDAYLERIGYTGETTATADALRALHRAHIAAIPFENLEIVLGRPILLDLESLQAKLVRQRRGGYCYEHTALFAAVLEQLGFGVTGLLSRVRLGFDAIMSTTHAVLRVEIPGIEGPGRLWLADTGFGGASPDPLELADGAASSWGAWSFRLHQEDGHPGPQVWVLQRRSTGDWLDLHGFTVVPQYPVDYDLGNYWISTHPRSPFTGRLMVQRITEDAYYILDDTRLTITAPDGSTQQHQIPPEELPAHLREEFGIELSTPDSQRLVEQLRPAADPPGR